MSQHDKKPVAKHLFDQGETIAEIARQLDVSRRTIERWADEGAWREKRGVIPIGEAKKKPLQRSPESNHNPPAQRPRPKERGGEALSEIEIIETAIFDLAAAMGAASSEDLRSLGGLASGLVRLLEYRRKICPPTAAELAELAIALKIPPAEFAAELRRAWQLRA